MSKKDLENEIKAMEERISFYSNWLAKNFDNPERMKIAQDKNHLSVKLHTAKYKLSNLRAGEPQLGYGEGLAQNVLKPEVNNKSHR